MMFKFFCFFLLFLAQGCVLLPRLKPVDLAQPGWQVREGQAVWQTGGGKIELAGEVMVARHPDGFHFVQFSKTPFPIVIAQTTPNHWQIEIPAQDRRYTGPGKPPARFAWLHLPGVLEGKAPPKGWNWSATNDHWRLANDSRREVIEGFLAP